MRLKVGTFALLVFLSTSALAAAPCTLDREVLLPYELGAAATEEQWRDSRRAIMDFTECDASAIDAASRRLFFEVVRAEFEADHKPALERWVAKRPESEALFEAIRIFEYRLREVMDRIVTPDDGAFAETILAYGSAKAIAALGPAVQRDVIRQLGKPGHAYGVAKQYDAQREAVGALGYWIDPADDSFSAAEKATFVAILTSLLENE